uniref:MHC class I-like antigen recognition-like domain-containing protein n=1 Tax=Hucho hucho TaxID=62062 RepID=A0A4W5QF08_9TELE
MDSLDSSKQDIRRTFILLSHAVSTHSLHYVYTATSGIPDFPEFVNLGIVDGMQIDYYDSNTKRVVPKQDWMAKTEGSDYWERETQKSIGAEQTFKAGIAIIKNEYEYVHINIWMSDG